jgi:hypothetical protein
MSSSSLKTPLRCQIPANRSSIVLLWQSFSSQPHGSDSTLLSLCHNWLDSAHRLDLCTGQRFITSWNTWQAPPALRSRIDEARVAPTCYLATPMRIGEIAVHGDQRLVHSCCTTRHQSCGSRRCSKIRLSPRQRQSTTPHLRPVLRSCILEPFWNDLASLRRSPHQCMRTTLRASSGAITSSADVNEPSALTSASTLLMK